MVKRSDFAQKLLDDLRVRKERMSAAQSSKSSKPITADAYSYSKQAYSGSREMKTHRTAGLKNGSTCHKSTGGNRSLSIGEASNEIVPFGTGRSSKQIGDLSLALAFALENGGKLRRKDSSGNSSVLDFLNQIGRRPVDMAKMERSSIDRNSSSATSRFPTLSHLHIKEISKGAQKLNQILSACSNGLNFDRYSIEIGRELLKGAMDLEESLRMLVNLQEASEYMISPQSKTRITLLDDDEDDDNIVKKDENKQLAKPMFSFDKPSKNSHYIQEAARTDLKQRLMALNYKSETMNFGHNEHILSSSNSTSQRRPASYSPNVKTFAAFSEHKNHSSPSKLKAENGRIPNVIAKLMGLEELPENDNSKYITMKKSSSKEKTEQTVAKKTADGSLTHERKTTDAGNLVSTIRKHKQIQTNQIQLAQDTTHILQAERNLASQHTSIEGTIHAGKSVQKDVEGIKPMRSSNNADMKIGKHQRNIDQSSQRIGSRKDIQEKEQPQDNPKLREQKGNRKGENKDLILKHQLQQLTYQRTNGSEAPITLQGQAESNLSILKTKRRDMHKLLSDNQPNSPNDLAFQQTQMLQNFELQGGKHHAGENGQQSVKEKIQVRRQIGSESRSLPKKHSHTSQATTDNGSSTESTGTVQSVGFPNKKHHGDLAQEKISSNFSVNVQDSMNKNSNQNSSPRNLNTEVIKEKNRTSIPPEMEEKSVHLPAVQKVKVTKVQQAVVPQKTDELVTRRSGNPHNLARPPKHQTSILQEAKQKRHNKFVQSKEEEQVRSSRTREAETCILKPKNQYQAHNNQTCRKDYKVKLNNLPTCAVLLQLMNVKA
ncbi:hypothetical protein GH714_015244 [Hevea brasiliensis]|uniref:DUF3741 domain-containing protein n=1 Tax=Hevea brasiliensis TaxID=3981 RepID=A0A6A6NHC6_HEVBR|nr:hypothetical protein GH714_015244 [Hevea brasiliensis]